MARNLKYWPESPVLLNGGLNLVDKEWKLSDNQTNKVRNVWWYNGEIGKRWGQELLDDGIAVESPCYSTYKYLFQGYIIKHCGTKLYKQDPTTSATTEIYTGLTAQKGSFFKFNSKLYYINGAQYVVYDGTTVTVVTPYIPTIIINRTPTGGGNTNEQYNRIGPGFRNSFNGTGAATAFTMTDINLDATAVTATVGGVAKVETTDFTVNRTTGVVTFTAAPALGTNNVIITACKTDTAAINSILNCKCAMPFGGQNDNRIFLGGNGTGSFYYTGISSVGVDASYWPYNYYNIIGNPDDDITGFAKSYDVLTIHKETGEIYGETYTWTGTVGIFNTFPIAQKGGCDCPWTLDVVNNHPVWLNSKYGAGILLGTSVGNQRNVFHISRNIDPWLLKESNLIDAVSVDFNGHYCLCVNDKVYPWNYFITPYVDTGNPEESAKRLSWWYWDNINAGSFITDGQDLYYGERDTGKVVHFITVYDGTQFYDFDEAISSIYRIPLRDLGAGVFEFDVLEMWIDCRGDTKTAIHVVYITSDDINGDPATDDIEVGSFSLDTFSLDTFTLQVMGYKETFPLTPSEKKIDLFGVELSNNEPGRDMNIGDVKYSYKLGKKK